VNRFNVSLLVSSYWKPYHSYEIARAFVKVGARVIMVNRKEEQGDDAIQKIKSEVGEDAQIEWVGCDMGNLKQIKEVIGGIAEKEERLDLVSNSSYIGADLI